MEDHQIIDLYWKRDPQAIEETRIRHGVGLHRIATGILRSHEDSEECVSDTYMTAWQTMPPVRPMYLFAYLAKICRNGALGMLDRRKAQKRYAEIVELSDELQSCIADHRQSDPADHAALTAALNSFLAKLSREDRMLFMRRYWYGDQIAELANAFSMGQSAVKTRLFRLRNKLKKHLQQEGFDL